MVVAAGTVANVDYGPGWVYVAPIGTTEPADASTALPSAWRAVGYTESGNSRGTEITAEDIEVAEELEPIITVETKRLTTITFDMAEVTRGNLALALNAGANVATSAASLDPPALGASVDVMIVWDSLATVSASNIRWIFRKCRNVSNIEVQSRKAPQKGLIPVSFRCNKPTGAEAFRVFPNSAGLIA